MSALRKESSQAFELDLGEDASKKIEGLKQQQLQIKEQIQTAKAKPVVRQQDESTRVFNLRQLQMEEQLKELEKRKEQGERELQVIQQQKNSTLHSDLRRIAQFLVQETRKIVPVEKELESKFAAIANLKGELQHLFETSRLDRQKNLAAMEEQGQAISAIGEQVRATSEFLRKDFQQVTAELERISQEKIKEQQSLLILKEEVAAQQGLLQEAAMYRGQVQELERQRHELDIKLKSLAHEEQRLQAIKAEVAHQVEQLEALKLQHEAKKLEVSQLQQQQHSQESQLQHLEQSLQGRKSHQQQIELEIIEAKKRLDVVREQEGQALHASQRERQELAELQNEVARLHGVKSAAVELQQEALQLLQQQKESHEREMEYLARNHQSRLAELDAQFEAKKQCWESEFQTWCQRQKDEFEKEIELVNKRDLDELRRKKRDFSQQVFEAMKTELGRAGFETAEQRAEHVRRQVELIFDGFFDRTSRWKFW